MSETADPVRQQHVLLIDDDEVFVSAMARALRGRGFEVTVCTSAAKAKSLIAGIAPDLALVDLRLPDGSGLCLVNELRRYSPDTAVVVLTGYGSIASAVEAMKLGAVNYLCKPVDADTVVAAFGRDDGESVDGAVDKADEGITEAEGDEAVPDQPLTVMRLEWEYINRVLASNDGNISATARALNMHRRTLQRKLLKRPVPR
ncbi:MAG TPA: response regulator [Rhodocyclaceae bacterium]